jgi:tRNA threonylcarbamoyladenosine biosynthesis protein TsaB
LAVKGGAGSSALDAHRHEVFLRVGEPGGKARELLAGSVELAAIYPAPGRVAVCDEAAAELLRMAWPGAELVRTEAPGAANALELGAGRIAAREFADIAAMDGHYLRRSDAEIFGEAAVGMPA